MARLTADQKVHRALQLLMGLKHPRVVSALAGLGFDQGAYDEGWRLLRAAVATELVPAPPEGPTTRELLERLHAWEKTWFPLAEAALRRRHPALHARVFLNLDRAQGATLYITVGAFVDRVEALEAGDDEARSARALLHKRGLSAAVLAEANAIRHQLATVRGGAPPAIDEAAVEAAQAALWAWYLEWSRVARTAIRDGHLLRRLGFRPNRTATADDLDDHLPDADAP